MDHQYGHLFNRPAARNFLADRAAEPDGANKLPCFGLTAPLLETAEGLSFLYQVRSPKLAQQPGEVCFPGGRIEPGEAPDETAVRETCEELLVKPEQIELLGPGDILVMPFNIILYPYLSRLHNYDYTFSKAEVETVFTVPLTWLKENPPTIYKNPMYYEFSSDFPVDKLGIDNNYPYQKGENPMYYYEYGDHIIWGMTARMTAGFMDLIDRALLA